MTTQIFEKTDIEKNRKLCAVGYFIFFIPLLVRDSPFARFHANQALVLVVINAVGVGVELALFLLLPAMGALLYSIWPFVILILAIYGCANAAKGHAKQLPVIGKITFLKGAGTPGMAGMAAQKEILQIPSAASNETTVCPECGAPIDKRKKFCGSCGAKITVHERLCSQCGMPVPQGMSFCGNCGTKYAEPEPKERICSNCGRILEEKEKFCMECGTAAQ